MIRSTLRHWAMTSLLLALSTPASAALEKYVVIDGVDQVLELEQNTRLEADADATHFKGNIKGFPQSWARVSHIGEQWDGLVMHEGRIYPVTALADSQSRARSATKTHLSAVNGFESLGTCAVVSPSRSAAKSLQAKSLTVNSIVTQAATVDFPTDCAEDIDGVCLVAEITVFFDSKFREAYPTDYQSRGAEILNIVDGFYQNELKIIFKHLRTDFSNAGQFTSNRNPLDILFSMAGKRGNNQILPNDPNKQSIMHLVSGRDFLYEDNGDTDDNVIGLAFGPSYEIQGGNIVFTPILCDTDGSAVSTSQLLYKNAKPSAALTAIVVAHELGHNFGMEHDGDAESTTASTCTVPTNIMNSSLVETATRFSDCSKDAAGLNISALPAVEACFDFPIEATLSADGGNATETGVGSLTQHQFTVGLQTANGINGNITVAGNITAGDGSINSASLAGNSCALSNANTEYSCTSASLGTTSNLSVSFTTGNEHLQFSHNVSLATNLYDMNTANNSIATTIEVKGIDLAPTTLTAKYEKSVNGVVLRWQDHATNEDAYQVERQIGSGDWQIIEDTLAPNTTQHIDHRLLPNEIHSYRVSAIFAGISSAPTPVASLNVQIISNRLRDHRGSGGSLGWWSLGILLFGMSLRRIKTSPIKA